MTIRTSNMIIYFTRQLAPENKPHYAIHTSKYKTELLKAKCLTALYYGLEACPVNKSQIRSLEYVLNNTFVEIGWTGDSGNWCGTSVEFWFRVTGCDFLVVGTSVEMLWLVRCRVELGVGTKCLWCVVKVGRAMEGRGRFIRSVCGNK